MHRVGVRRWYQATFMGTDDVHEIHRFPLESNPERSTYTAMTSISWFQERAKPEKITVIFEPLIFVLKLERLRKARESSPFDYVYGSINDPHFLHESLWTFYTSIGYDYKKKKWGERPPRGPVLTREQLDEICTKLDANYLCELS